MAISNIFALIFGACLIGSQTNWKIGLGAALLVWFSRSDGTNPR